MRLDISQGWSQRSESGGPDWIIVRWSHGSEPGELAKVGNPRIRIKATSKEQARLLPPEQQSRE